MTLVAYWPLHESSGDARDVVGNNNGTVNGATQGASGILGETAYDFDGSNDSISTSWNGPYDNTKWSISSWFKTTDDSSFGAIVGNYDGSFPQVKLSMNNVGVGELSARIRDSSSSDTIISSGENNATGSWNHGAMIRENGIIYLYVNGILVNSGDDGTTEADLTSGNIRIGSRDDDDEYYNGSICELRAYDHALTPSEVQYLYEVTQTAQQMSNKKTL